MNSVSSVMGRSCSHGISRRSSLCSRLLRSQPALSTCERLTGTERSTAGERWVRANWVRSPKLARTSFNLHRSKSPCPHQSRRSRVEASSQLRWSDDVKNNVSHVNLNHNFLRSHVLGKCLGLTRDLRLQGLDQGLSFRNLCVCFLALLRQLF